MARSFPSRSNPSNTVPGRRMGAVVGAVVGVMRVWGGEAWRPQKTDTLNSELQIFDNRSTKLLAGTLAS